MEFTEELLKKLAEEGISWERCESGVLYYMANHEHASAEVYPDEQAFKVVNECCDVTDNGVLCERTFRGSAYTPEEILRAVAESCGRLDQGIEDALGAVDNFDINQY